MSDERTYPRQWFRLPKGLDNIDAHTFDRETTHSLFGARGCVRKHTDWHDWFPTLEEAKSELNDRKQRKSELKAAALVRAAAPDLLEALEALVNPIGADPEKFPRIADIHAFAEAAIAKAKGGAA